MSRPKQAAINVSHLEGIRFRMKCPPDHFETGNRSNVFQLLSSSPVPPAPMITIRICSLLQVIAAIYSFPLNKYTLQNVTCQHILIVTSGLLQDRRYHRPGYLSPRQG